VAVDAGVAGGLGDGVEEGAVGEMGAIGRREEEGVG